jgi:hypothetical protein
VSSNGKVMHCVTIATSHHAENVARMRTEAFPAQLFTMRPLERAEAAALPASFGHPLARGVAVIVASMDHYPMSVSEQRDTSTHPSMGIIRFEYAFSWNELLKQVQN